MLQIFFNNLIKLRIWTPKQEQKIRSDPTPSLSPSLPQRGFLVQAAWKLPSWGEGWAIRAGQSRVVGLGGGAVG